MLATETTAKPWYRHPMVWFMIAIPFSAVLFGIVMLTLAIRSEDGLVVDDYYREGKEINKTLARDEAALAHGVNAELALNFDRHRVEVRLQAGRLEPVPGRLQLGFYHATRSHGDQVLELQADKAGLYHAPMPVLGPGRWYIQLSAQDWRLTGTLELPQQQSLKLSPRPN